MNEKTIRLVTAESVRAGHPDKFCDQVADAILDAHLRQDPNARVAVEVFATAGKIVVGGEITSKAKVSYDKIVAGVINRIGYTMSDLCGDSHGLLELEVCLHEQSPDISAAVGKSMLDAGKTLGAGDQGIMVGYATNETEEYLPLPVVLAHRICKRLDELKPQTTWLGADGKAQVTVAYENDVPVAVTAVVVSLQHDAEIDHKSIRRFIGKEVLGKVLPRELLKEDTRILINPSGKFVLGGPVADTGLTGRKLAVDQYGPVAHIGGGALSGKDPTKVDRSGAYAARWVAKNIVAAGMAKRCEVQIAYAICPLTKWRRTSCCIGRRRRCGPRRCWPMRARASSAPANGAASARRAIPAGSAANITCVWQRGISNSPICFQMKRSPTFCPWR